MRVLHVVKTSEGAGWAAAQAAELVRAGVEVHVALPNPAGRTVARWREAGAHLHFVNLDFPVRKPWIVRSTVASAQRLVAAVAPDLIHSHFVGTTLLLRLALGRKHCIPRIFQVPGPLHLEHRLYRALDLQTAGLPDYWIGSSSCIVEHYRNAGVTAQRLFLSYYGTAWPAEPPPRRDTLRNMLRIPASSLVVGNANFIYPPKWFLGQRVGLKCHEDVIDAIGMVTRKRKDVVGVLIGGTFGAGSWYEERLRRRAEDVGAGRIKMPGFLASTTVLDCWPDFDCAVHVPLSENCGGVVEPLWAGVPVVAGRVGGLPEVVYDGITGVTVPVRQPRVLADALLGVLDRLEHHRALADNGRRLVMKMFDVRRTAAEVYDIYRYVLKQSDERPAEFDPGALAKRRLCRCAETLN